MSPIREQAARLSRKKRTRGVPQAEPLDDRVVPAVVGAGHGGFAVEAAAQHQNPYVMRLQETRQQMQARRDARIEQIQVLRQQRIEQVQALRQQRLDRISALRPAPNPFAYGIRTPRGPLALASLPSNSTTVPNNPTSPNDFPYGPGGFYSVGRAPGGEIYGVMGAGASSAASSPSHVAPATPVSSSTAQSLPTGLNSMDASTSTTTTGSNTATITNNPTSPNDFPYGPGGFFSIGTAPDGSIYGVM